MKRFALSKRGGWSALLIAAFVALVLLYWFYWRPVSSIQAFVNTGIIHVRGPIRGELRLQRTVRPGALLREGEVLGEINSDVENPRIIQLRIQREHLMARRSNLAESLRGIETKLESRRRMNILFSAEAEEQSKLQERYARARVAEVTAELRQARIDADNAASERRRAEALYRQGDVSTAFYEKADSLSMRAEAEHEALDGELTQAKAALQAASAGLQLDGPRSFSYPHMRLRELEIEILDLKQSRVETQQMLAGAEQELARVQDELEKQSSVTVRSPIAGVVWSLDTLSGERLDNRSSIAQLIDCDNVWVDAFFRESDVAAGMRAGAAVRVVRPDTGQTWSGTVRTLRGGAGRVTVGQYVAQPPPEVAERQLPVRVVTARIDVNWRESLDPQAFCHAGTSVEVTMQP